MSTQEEHHHRLERELQALRETLLERDAAIALQTHTIDLQTSTITLQTHTIDTQTRTIDTQTQTIDAQTRTIAEQEQTIAEQKSLINQLKRMLFGPKSEKLTEEQKAELAAILGDLKDQENRPPSDADEMFQEDKETTDKDQKAKGDKEKGDARRKRRSRQIPVNLEVVTTVLEPEGANCEHCGQLGDKIGQEVSEQIDLIPARLVVRRTVRNKRRCQCGCGRIAIAPLPAQPLPGSKMGVGLAVFILLSKYEDHLALYTLERMFRERHQVSIPRQQMVQWIEHMGGLLRLITDRMWARMKQGDYIQIDETPVNVLDPEVKGKTAKAYLWFFAVPAGDVMLVFDRRRSHTVPLQALGDFNGTFQSDDFSAYDTLSRKRPGLRRIGCAAHARRKFYTALLDGDRDAHWFIGEFRKLYAIEDEVGNMSPGDRQARRNAGAPPIWAAMKLRALELQPRTLPKSHLGNAIKYFLHEYDVLQIYLERHDYRIDNNLCENAIRPTCVGRRRWLFIGHPDAGWRSAVIYSIIQSCRRRGIDTQEYLTDLLTRMPGMKNTEIDSLLPENWKSRKTT